VFLFHGVIPEDRPGLRNYNRKHIPLAYFEEILADLTQHGTAFSMDEVVDGTKLPPRAYAITFDDGFANNSSVAAPALEKLALAATFYVTTGFVDDNSSSWIDLIEHALEVTPAVSLELPPAEQKRVYRTRSDKIELLEAIRRHVKSDRELDPYDYAAGVLRQLNVHNLEPDPDLDQKLTWNDVRRLHEHPLFIVGGHGQTHRILERLDDESLAAEIETSCTLLERHLGATPRHYSYPEGLADCYSDRVIALLRERGVVCSPSAEEGVNRRGDDLFRLKRILVT
jgi:peptidoglycan/xylan/chitin deacetylase (PgdA/CDA1 family)